MSYTIKGKVLRVGDSIAVTERMTKRAIVVETNDNPKYPQVNEVEFTGDRCTLLDGISPGDTVEIEFSLRGREWTSPKGEIKVFNTLSGWKIDHAGAGRHASPPPPAANPDDDLPFATAAIGHEPSAVWRHFR